MKHMGILGMLALLACGNPAESPGITLIDDTSQPRDGSLKLMGLPSAIIEAAEANKISSEMWPLAFAVWLGEKVPPASDEIPPMAGSYTFEDDALYFKPLFPFKRGRPHVAQIDFSPFNEALGLALTTPATVFHFEANARSIEPPRVLTFYPQATTLPANVLKLYVQFSQPMRRGKVYDYVRLENDKGEAIEGAFLEMDHELWSKDGKRLTVFFHPGRIKRGVGGHERDGLALTPGANARLSVDGNIRNAGGEALGTRVTQTWQVGAIDRRSPQPDTWRLTIPLPGTREPLTLSLDEPLDHALMARYIGVRIPNGPVVRGEVKINDAQNRWQLIPERPWQAGDYALEADSRLEDLAGNRLDGLFDVDLYDEVETADGIKGPVAIPFTIGSSNRNE